MLQVTGFYDLYQSRRYIMQNDIPGDIVECGCFLGGSSIFIRMMRTPWGLEDRTLHVFDTFAGFPPGSEDVRKGVPTKGPRYPPPTNTSPPCRRSRCSPSSTAGVVSGVKPGSR